MMNNMNKGKKTGTDAKFFSSTNRKGENHELREELRSPQRDRKRDAVKKVIANMTVGKDVSSLFMDVINCIQTDNLELKKLVYLYLINYAKTQPDQAILAVNTFVKDANDPNPLIRALAIRTMGCIRVEKITEYLCEPLGRSLKDENPYVRKTAAICTAKLYDISPELVEERGFLDILNDLISDSNPTVVSNAVAALAEISETSGKDVMIMTSSVLQKLLAALNECTEWGQIFILDSLSRYIPQDSKEAEGIIERVSPRLQHSNSAVVMSTVKIILRYMEEVTNQEVIRSLNKKLAPPLVTLLNSEPEIQFVALRNINLIVLKRPKVLEHEIKVFFCKYNDPIYVKMEKLEIIIRLASERNIDQVLLELKEYSTEVDVEFVRKAVRAIGRCAIKLERSTERCINVLLDLIQTKVSYVVQEAVVVIKDIFRKYPNRYESIIGSLCENLEDLDEPEAKAAMVWIIGEYADLIENPNDLLDSFLESFQEETSNVQLQLLTATVKLFLKQPESSAQESVKKILNLATVESDNPDLRDRGYFYWRLLSHDPEAARAVIMAEKPEIGVDSGGIDQSLLDVLIGQISSLASVYHKPAEAFIMKSMQLALNDNEDEDEDENDGENGDNGAEEENGDNNRSQYNNYSSNNNNNKVVESAPNLLDFDDSPSAPVGNGNNNNNSFSQQRHALVSSEAGKGVFISGNFAKNNGNNVFVELEIGCSLSTAVQNFAIQFNKNIFGLSPMSPQVILSQPVSNNNKVVVSIPLTSNPNFLNPNATSVELGAQVAMKNMHSGEVMYFVLPYQPSLLAVFAKSSLPAMEVEAFVSAWKSIDNSLEVSSTLYDLSSTDQEVIKNKFKAVNVSYVATRDVPNQPGQISTFFSAQTVFGVTFILELKFKAGMNVCKITVKSPSKNFSEICKNEVEKILK